MTPASHSASKNANDVVYILGSMATVDDHFCCIFQLREDEISADLCLLTDGVQVLLEVVVPWTDFWEEEANLQYPRRVTLTPALAAGKAWNALWRGVARSNGGIAAVRVDGGVTPEVGKIVVWVVVMLIRLRYSRLLVSAGLENRSLMCRVSGRKFAVSGSRGSFSR